MKRQSSHILALLGVMALTLACNSLQGVPGRVTAETQAATITEPSPATRAVVTPQATGDAGLLFADDFSTTDSMWSRSKVEGFVLAYADGAYVARIKDRGRSALNVGVLERDLSFDDAVIAVDVSHHFGDPAISGAVVAWRVQDFYNYYALLLTADGYASVRVLASGKWKDLYDWTRRDAIAPGEAINHVVIAFKADKADIYVNQARIFSVDDPTYTQGTIGLGAVIDGDGDMEVAFDNLAVYDYERWVTPAP